MNCGHLWRARVVCLVTAFLALSCPGNRVFAAGAASPAKAPPEFTAQDEKDLDAARDSLEALRRTILAAKLTKEESAAAAREFARLSDVISALETKKENWENRRTSRRAGALAPFDYGRFFSALGSFQYYYRQMQEGNRVSASEWEALAVRLNEFAGVRFSGPADENSCYILRAWLLEGECYLFASVDHCKAGRSDEHLFDYYKGLEVLEALLDASSQFPEPIPGIMPATHRSGEKDTFWYAGSSRGGGTNIIQVPTQDTAARFLSDYCPWGIAVRRFLSDAGFFDKFDWKLLKPYGGDDPTRLWEVSLKKLPPHVKSDTDAILGGKFKFGGEEAIVEWATPARASHSIWIMGPSVYDMSIAQSITWGMRGVKLVENVWGYMLDEFANYLVSVIGDQLGPDSITYASCGYTNNARRVGLLTNDFIVKGEAQKVPYKSARTVLATAAGFLERKEIEYLFETANPSNSELRASLGDQKSYDRAPIPPIIIRTDILGFVETKPYKYRRTLHIVKYYGFDPRALAGVTGPYNLETNLVTSLPGAAAYLGGDSAIQSATWKELPNAPQPLGTRAFLTDFSPKGQIIYASFGGGRVERWRREMPPEKQLFAILYAPRSYGQELMRLEMSRPDCKFYVYNERVPPERQPFNRDALPRTAAWLSEPFTEYVLKVVYAARDQTGAVPVEDELESINVRFIPEPDKSSPWVLSSADTGWVQLDYAPNEFAQEVPENARLLILPRVIFVDGIDEATGKLDCYDGTRRECEVNVAVAPLDPVWHKLTIDVGGKKYTAWDDVGSLSSAAIYKVALPLPAGESKVVVSADGATSVSFVAVREPKNNRDRQIASSLGSVKDYVEQAKKARDAGDMKSYYSRSCSVLEEYKVLTWYYVEALKHADARKAVDSALKEAVAAEEIERAGFADIAKRLRTATLDLLEASAYIALYESDADRMLTDTNGWIALWQEVNGSELAGKDKAKLHAKLADRYGVLITRLILIGASQGKIVELKRLGFEKERKLSGYYEEGYDTYIFKFGY